MSEDKPQWKQTSGFADDTEVAQVVCKQEDLEKWDEEAEENGRTRSRYLYTLIEEARSYREHGLVQQDGSQKRIQELEQQVGQLQKRLEEKESESSEAVSFDPETLKQDVLTDQYQSLEEILRRIVETGILDDVIRVPVENQLYFLAAQNEVEYERGWGWKLTNGGGN